MQKKLEQKKIRQEKAIMNLNIKQSHKDNYYQNYINKLIFIFPHSQTRATSHVTL